MADQEGTNPQAEDAAPKEFDLWLAARSNRGGRAANEDAFRCKRLDPGEGNPLGLAAILVVCDGMGGHAAGEVASRIAASGIEERLTTKSNDGDEGDSLGDVMRRAVATVHEAIAKRAADDPSCAGMGTTITAAALKGSQWTVAHVGDSRAYLLRDGGLRRLTQDHSAVAELVRHGHMTEEQAEESILRNQLTRAVGVSDAPEVDILSLRAEPGDRLILCSDGLNGFVSDEQIREISRGGPNAGKACDGLIQAALDAKTSDNVTVAVADVLAPGERAQGAGARKPQVDWRVVAGTVVVALLLCVIGFVFYVTMRPKAVEAPPSSAKVSAPVRPAAQAESPRLSIAFDDHTLTYRLTTDGDLTMIQGARDVEWLVTSKADPTVVVLSVGGEHAGEPRLLADDGTVVLFDTGDAYAGWEFEAPAGAYWLVLGDETPAAQLLLGAVDDPPLLVVLRVPDRTPGGNRLLAYWREASFTMQDHEDLSAKGTVTWRQDAEDEAPAAPLERLEVRLGGGHMNITWEPSTVAVSVRAGEPDEWTALGEGEGTVDIEAARGLALRASWGNRWIETRLAGLLDGERD